MGVSYLNPRYWGRTLSINDNISELHCLDFSCVELEQTVQISLISIGSSPHPKPVINSTAVKFNYTFLTITDVSMQFSPAFRQQ